MGRGLIKERDPDNLNVFRIKGYNQDSKELDTQHEFIKYVFGVHGYYFSDKWIEFNSAHMYPHLPRMINQEITKVLKTSTDVQDLVTHLYAVLMKKSPLMAFTMLRDIVQELQLGQYLLLP